MAIGLVLAGATAVADWDESTLEGLKWREVGPWRGGRAAAVAGIPQDRKTYYFGATGGGVWKTVNGGQTWVNVSDGTFGGSIGAVAVSEWDPNVVYVGTGETTVRGNVSHGDGVWKSTDAGRTWAHAGLPDSRHIGRVRVHPRDPELVYAAVLGHLFGPSEQRGVFRSRDGGRNWQRVLYVDDAAGAIDLAMDPTNPRILYATTWRVLRTPWSLESGGPGSGIWKSTDGGDSWQELTRNKGLPAAPLGIAGITVSPANPDNLYAIVEAAEGGVFRSRDAGASWQRVNAERKLRQRAWYYSRIYADPADEESVYVLNVRFHRSRDGGRSFEPVDTPHGDNHDLWIDPSDPARMIESNDGGAQVSINGGKTWTGQDNQPTAQLYRVSVDNDFPYRLLGGQQDNSALRIRSRSATGAAIGERDWEPTAGGESGHVVARPDNPDVVFGGSYGGTLIRVDHASGDVRAVNVWPDNPMGWGAAELKYRFNWNFPMLFSAHDAGTLYAGANVLFRTRDEGQSWQAISPDLTRNLKDRQGPSGGPITKDNTSVEYYGTLFALAESPLQAGVLWTGSDDGLVHVSRDGGASWSEVTPRGLPPDIQINGIEAHPFEAGGLYLAATAYKRDDFRPWLYVTTDYGKTWRKITDGISAGHFTRAVRADPSRRGLLYAGTERGVYVSLDDGERWRPLNLNLPQVPVTDLAVKSGNLVAATQGRGYWILDDLALLRQADEEVFERAAHLFQPMPAYRLRGGSRPEPERMGQNPPDGVVFRYWLQEAPPEAAELRLDILTAAGETIRSFTRQPSPGAGQEQPLLGDDDRLLSADAGLNQVEWNLRWPSVEKFAGLVLWNDSLAGPRATPGPYRARLTVADASVETAFEIRADPRLATPAAEFQAQFEFLWAVNRKLTETHRTIGRIRSLRSGLDAILSRGQDQGASGAIAGTRVPEPMRTAGEALQAELTGIEETLYQTQLESPQDPLNFPIRLNDKLAGVMVLAAIGDHAPTASMRAVGSELTAAIDAQLQRFEALRLGAVADFNRLAHEARLPLLETGEQAAPVDLDQARRDF